MSRNEEKTKKRRERRGRRRKTGMRIRTSRVTSPRGLVCKPGLAIGYEDDDQKMRVRFEKAIKWFDALIEIRIDGEKI